MENILYLFGGGLLGVIIGVSLSNRKNNNHQVIKMLKKILSKLGDNPEDEKLKAEIMAKLEKAIVDIKSTIN